MLSGTHYVPPGLKDLMDGNKQYVQSYYWVGINSGDI